MTIQDLINALEKIEDKTREIQVYDGDQCSEAAIDNLNSEGDGTVLIEVAV